MHERIVTHDDFDGVVSAALVSYFMEIDRVSFAGPGDMTNSRFPTGEADIVCDLPYPLQCGMWFDHHEANLEEVALRGIDPESIPGLRFPAPSCARVIRDYFAQEYEIEPDLESLVEETDRIDSFGYESIEQWRADTPAQRIDSSLKLREGAPAERRQYLRSLVDRLVELGLEETASRKDVIERAERFRAEEERMLETIRENFGHLDPEREIILLDFSANARRATMVKNLAQLLDPAALAVLEVNAMFRQGVKSTSLSFSMSLNIASFRRPERRDLGEIMRVLNIGSGHAGAASGRIDCAGKSEMLKAKRQVLDGILAEWKKQGAPVA